MESILDSIKLLLGISVDDGPSFDRDLVIHINSALSIINQLGVGPSGGFAIKDSTQTWEDFIGPRKDVEMVKTAVFLRVRLAFDPPQNSFLVSSIQKQIEEFDWRIEVQNPTPIEEPALEQTGE